MQRLYNDTKDTNDTIDTNNPHPKPSMPQVALTPLGLPSLATTHKKHSRMKASDASPSGILNHLPYPHHNNDN
jgi:hypothetical protein